MQIKAHIPNTLTLMNLMCGVLGIIILFHPQQWPEAYPLIGWFMVIAMLFDFFDGFVARALKVASPLGKELDSLADMVTFGVLPGLLVFFMISHSPVELGDQPGETLLAKWQLLHCELPLWQWLLPFSGLLIPFFSGYRLAKFNVDERQGSVFYGLATPANAFFWLSLFLIFMVDGKPFSDSGMEEGEIWAWLVHPLVLPPLALTFSLLLVSEFKLIAFKFKGFGFKDNGVKYIFLLLSVILGFILFYKAVPLIILLYFIFSFIDNRIRSNHEV